MVSQWVRSSLIYHILRNAIMHRLRVWEVTLSTWVHILFRDQMQINSSESVHLYPLPVKNRWTFRLLNFFCKSMTCELLNSLFCLLLQHQYYSYKVEKKENGWNKSRNRTQDPQTPMVQKVTTHTYIKSPNSIFSTRLCSKSSNV